MVDQWSKLSQAALAGLKEYFYYFFQLPKALGLQMNVEKFLSHKSLPSNICNSDDFLARSMFQFFPTLFPENLEPCPLENQYTLQHFAESLLSL